MVQVKIRSKEDAVAALASQVPAGTLEGNEVTASCLADLGSALGDGACLWRVWLTVSWQPGLIYTDETNAERDATFIGPDGRLWRFSSYLSDEIIKRALTRLYLEGVADLVDEDVLADQVLDIVSEKDEAVQDEAILELSDAVRRGDLRLPAFPRGRMHILIEWEDFLGADQLGRILKALSDLYDALGLPRRSLSRIGWSGRSLRLFTILAPPPVISGNSITIELSGDGKAVGDAVVWILKRRFDSKKPEKLEREAGAELERARNDREGDDAARKRAASYEADAELKGAQAESLRRGAPLAEARAQRFEAGLGKLQKAKADKAADDLERVLAQSPNIRRVSINDQDLDRSNVNAPSCLDDFHDS
jgi:hypothetical protein